MTAGTCARVCHCGQTFRPNKGQIDRGHGKYCSRTCFDKARRLARIAVTCPCGTSFQAVERDIAKRKGRYCSKACMYKHRVRPKGLTYDIKVQNKAWFQPGREAPTGPANPQWKGEAVGYRELHRWVAKHRAKGGTCERCEAEGETQWANKSHEYRRDLTDWLELCRKCHRNHDSGPAWGLATQKYGRRAVQEGC